MLYAYGVGFKTLKEIKDVLNMRSNLSQAVINRFYGGSLETLIATRLKMKGSSKEQIKSKLLELINQKDQPKDKETAMQLQPKELSELSNEQQCAKKYAQALLNKGDEQILNSLLLAFGCSRDDVLKYFDEIKKGV